MLDINLLKLKYTNESDTKSLIESEVIEHKGIIAPLHVYILVFIDDNDIRLLSFYNYLS